MDNILNIVQANLGGFVTGGVVAVLQLVAVYLWIDRRIESIQLKSEARKWKDARLELDATLHSLAHTIVRPIAYYTLSDERGVYLRDNYSACLQHVADKNATLDAMLAIYSVGLEPSSFSKITQLADRLRSTAGNAKMALLNLSKIENELPRIGHGKPTQVVGIKRATTSIEFEWPKNQRERWEKLFTHYLLQVISDVSFISQQMSELALAKYTIADLNDTSRYRRLTDMSKGEKTAESDQIRITESISQLKLFVDVIEITGVHLALTSEVD